MNKKKYLLFIKLKYLVEIIKFSLNTSYQYDFFFLYFYNFERDNFESG